MRKGMQVVGVIISLFVILISLQLVYAVGCYKWDTSLSQDYEKYSDSVGNLFIKMLDKSSVKPVCIEWKNGISYPSDDNFVIPCNYDEDCPGEGKLLYAQVEEGTSGYSDVGVWAKNQYVIFLCINGKCENRLLMTNECQNDDECEKISTLKGNEGKTICDKSKIPYDCILPSENKLNKEVISSKSLIIILSLVCLILVVIVVVFLVMFRSKRRNK